MSTSLPPVTQPAATQSDQDLESTWVWRFGYATGNCLQFVVIGLLLDFLLFSGVQILPVVEMLMLLLMILGVAQRQAWLVLVAFQTSLLVREVRSTSLTTSGISLGYVLLAMIVLIYTFQLDRVRDAFSRGVARLALMFFSSRTDPKPSTPLVDPANWVTGFSIGIAKLALRIVYLGSIVWFAAWLLRTLPFSVRQQRGLLENSLDNAGELWPGAAIISIALGAYLVMREFFWRQATPAQAGMYVRANFLREHHGLLASFIKRNLRLRSKKSKKKRKKK